MKEKRKLLNTEIADYVYEELNKKWNVDYNKILDDIDISIENGDEEIDDNGDLVKEYTEKEIAEMKKNILDGFLAKYEY